MREGYVVVKYLHFLKEHNFYTSILWDPVKKIMIQLKDDTIFKNRGYVIKIDWPLKRK